MGYRPVLKRFLGCGFGVRAGFKIRFRGNRVHSRDCGTEFDGLGSRTVPVKKEHQSKGPDSKNYCTLVVSWHRIPGLGHVGLRVTYGQLELDEQTCRQRVPFTGMTVGSTSLLRFFLSLTHSLTPHSHSALLSVRPAVTGYDGKMSGDEGR